MCSCWFFFLPQEPTFKHGFSYVDRAVSLRFYFLCGLSSIYLRDTRCNYELLGDHFYVHALLSPYMYVLVTTHNAKIEPQTIKLLIFASKSVCQQTT